jgi:hypothetical protein
MMHKYNFPCTFNEKVTYTEIYYDEKTKTWKPPNYMIEEFEMLPEYKCFEDTVTARLKHFEDCSILRKYNLPFIPSVISKKLKNEDMLRAFASAHLNEYSFVKLCTMSPKDCGICVFDNVDKLVSTIKNSERTKFWENKHLVMKKYREFKLEYRCIWILGKLKAVITKSDYNEELLKFIKVHEYNLPISGCIEIGYSEENNFEIIEINCIGPDMICDIYPFNWNENLLEFYGMDTFIWKTII